MNRRQFLKTTALAGCALHPMVCALGEEAAAPTPAQKLILGAPLTHSDWSLKAGIPWGEEGVRHMLDTCKACGWSRIYWRALDGGRSLYRSMLMHPQGAWDKDNFWDPQNDADRALMLRFTPSLTQQKRDELRTKFSSLDYAHFDSLASAVRYGHSIGLQIHAWVTINEDDHGWGIRSEFSKLHPQYRWVKRDGTVYHSQMSFAFDQVRKYKLSIIRELLRHYAIDGLFLDWIRTGDVRDNPQTDAQGVANSGYEQPLVRGFQASTGIDPHTIDNGDDRWVRYRARPQTQFMRKVRQVVRFTGRNLPVAAMVAHPWHYRGEMNRIDGNLRGLLLDVNTWAREGLVDAVVAAGYYRDGGTPEKAYEALRKETEGKVDVWSYAWVPQTVEEFTGDVALAKKLKAQQILFWEADYIDDRPHAAELKAAMSSAAKW